MPLRRHMHSRDFIPDSRPFKGFLPAGLILLACLFLVSAGTPAAAQTPAGITQLSMSGEPGDYIGGTTAYFYKAEDGAFSATASDRTGDGIPDWITVSFQTPGFSHWWYLDFSTSQLGKNLTPGFYDDAQRASFAASGHPGLDVSGDGRGCNTVVGNFTIHEAEFETGSSPRVLRFTASFEQRCEGGAATLYGTIYYNYTGSTPTHSITGRLAESNGKGTPGVMVQLGGSATATATTDAGGNFTFTNLIEGGGYRLTPTQGASYVVSPLTTSVRKLAADASVSFTTVPFYNISGTVTNSSGAAITGATIALSGSKTATATTDNSGAYSFTGLRADGNYTVTPSRTHYGFSPPSSTFNTLPGNQTANFVGTLLTHTIAGRVIDNLGVGVGGVTVNLTGTLATTTQTDANGNYSFNNLTAGGNYTVTPVMKYLTFSPPSSSFSDLSGNWGSVNFLGTRASYAISGVLLDSGGNPLGGAVVALGGTRSGTTVTNAAGNYSFSSLPAGGNYTLAPSKWNYVFSPTVRNSDDLSENRALNFVGTQDPAQFFVRQHYADFLGREPDAAGLQFWTDQMTNCGAADPLVCRINVSAAFFLSIEFQNTGYLVERMYKVAYGDATEASTGLVVPVIRRSEFLNDTPLISQDVVVNVGDWQSKLEANKTAYAQGFVQRQRFTDIYGPLSPADFVDRLDRNAGGVLTAGERSSLIEEASQGSVAARASVLRKVAENAELDRREKSRAFVLMQYYGYLRRDPDAAPDSDFRGWKFWLDKLNQFNGDYVQAEMVKAFISSDEYRRRFGQ